MAINLTITDYKLLIENTINNSVLTFGRSNHTASYDIEGYIRINKGNQAVYSIKLIGDVNSITDKRNGASIVITVPATLEELYEDIFELAANPFFFDDTEKVITTPRFEMSLFDEQIVAQRHPVIERKSAYPISALRDLTIVTGSATITQVDGEYKLSNTALGTDSGKLITTDIGRYMAHSDANGGLFLRLPIMPVGNQFAEWGLSDDSDELLFGADATGTYIKHVKAGVVKAKVYSNDWSDESGFVPSMDLAVGYVWSIEFAHYGGGNVRFSLWHEDSANKLQKYVLHYLSLDNEILLTNPNLPIKVVIDNNATATVFDAYVGGRQYSIDGVYQPSYRSNGDTFSFTGITTTPTLIGSFRKKAGEFQNINSKVSTFHVSPDATCYWWIVKNNTLTAPSWVGLTNQQVSETGLEKDISATDAIDGIVIAQGHAVGTNRNDTSFVESLNHVMSFQQPISIYIASKATTVDGDCTLDIFEEW